MLSLLAGSPGTRDLCVGGGAGLAGDGRNLVSADQVAFEVLAHIAGD